MIMAEQYTVRHDVISASLIQWRKIMRLSYGKAGFKITVEEFFDKVGVVDINSFIANPGEKEFHKELEQCYTHQLDK